MWRPGTTREETLQHADTAEGKPGRRSARKLRDAEAPSHPLLKLCSVSDVGLNVDPSLEGRISYWPLAVGH